MIIAIFYGSDPLRLQEMMDMGKHTSNDVRLLPRSEKHNFPGKLKIFLDTPQVSAKPMRCCKHRTRPKKKGLMWWQATWSTMPDQTPLLSCRGWKFLPCREIDYRGITLKEFDLDQALQRKPQLHSGR